MAEKSGPSIAIIALCVSIVSLGFSGYQWWYGKSEARILAAIDITKRQSEEKPEDTKKWFDAAKALYRDGVHPV